MSVDRPETFSRTMVIEPHRGWTLVRFDELWQHRELLYFLVWRDIKVRYKQTVLGAGWALLQPLLTMAVFSFFFGRLGKLPSDGVPYPLFVLAALVPWQLFAHAFAESANSLVTNHQMITKVYFPRIIVPLAATLAGLVDFTVALVLLLGVAVAYGAVPTLALLALPLLVFFALLTAFAVGLWLSALNVEYRDVRYTLPFLTQFWLLATPIAYPATMVPARLRPLLGLNPMAGVVEGFRWALLGTRPSLGSLIPISVGVVLVLLGGGLLYFRRVESTFADVI